MYLANIQCKMIIRNVSEISQVLSEIKLQKCWTLLCAVGLRSLRHRSSKGFLPNQLWGVIRYNNDQLHRRRVDRKRSQQEKRKVD